MKITEVKTFPVFYESRNYTFVKIETDEGIYGMGEFGLTWREQAGLGAIRHMASEYREDLADTFPGGFLPRRKDQHGGTERDRHRTVGH